MDPGALTASKDPISSQLDGSVISDSESETEISITTLANHFRSNLIKQTRRQLDSHQAVIHTPNSTPGYLGAFQNSHTCF